MSLFDSTPSSQKADVKPISFLLADLNTGTNPTELTLYVRPEELTHTSPARQSVQQTLGGAWGDVFGAGVDTINISGNTGWRQGADAKDGVQRFLDLKSTVLDQWIVQRAAAYKLGRDPSKVQLWFVDTLDQFAGVVIPGQVVLRRSKSRPLLLQYQIPLTVVSDKIGSYDSSPAILSADEKQSLGLTSLLDSINSITKFMKGISSWINSTILAPVQAFTAATTKVFNAVKAAVSATLGIGKSLMNVASSLALAGANIFNTISAVMQLPGQIMAQVMALSSAYTNVFCLLKNAISVKNMYQDYSPLFGASNCSSTSGGSPLSVYRDVNPFYKVVPGAGTSAVTLTTSAQSSLASLSKTDPVLAPMSATELAAHVSAVNDGMAVAA
ncbi:hypothetical protein [Paraburkholderia phenoliruptrix]|uniref:hypothetical protein n=1 Tax=Paraburkholderia phenoliruptrix TaxID=252970 RepID=UPI0034CE3A76